MNTQTWINCNCDSNHRTFRTWTKCKLPHAVISGEGSWMVVKPCRAPRSRGTWNVRLHDDEVSAKNDIQYGSGTCDPARFFMVHIEAAIGGGRAAQKAEQMRWNKFHGEEE